MHYSMLVQGKVGGGEGETHVGSWEVWPKLYDQILR